jgi:hypothetical protein
MTREELKAHCIRQIEQIEMWAKCKGEKPSGKIYEEHKLILELLEQKSIFDKIFCIVYPSSIVSTPELEHKAIMQIAEMLEPLFLPESEGKE